jgi:hypothetical protein
MPDAIYRPGDKVMWHGAPYTVDGRNEFGWYLIHDDHGGNFTASPLQLEPDKHGPRK